jgi:hypothetical protein
VLHITNGDSAADRIRQTGIDGEILPWRDILHEGPVPAGLAFEALSRVRAQFIAEQLGPPDGVGDAFAERDATLISFRQNDEVILWFEHDLYDQLQLFQLLDWFARQGMGPVRLSLVQADDYLGPATPERLRVWFDARHTVSAGELALGRRAWEAFRAPEPSGIAALLKEDTSVLPFLKAALLRHLEQFPATGTGLSRSETQALEAIAAGRATPEEAYVASHHERENPIFLGDTIFALYLERLSGGPAPLVLFADGASIKHPDISPDGHGFWARHLILTDVGHAVLEGRADQIYLNGIDRWLGGVHLHAGASIWRWSPSRRKIEGT